MNSSQAELESLIHACIDGHATEDQASRLNARLRTDADARDLFLQLADLHACLAVDEQLWVSACQEASQAGPLGLPFWPLKSVSRAATLAALAFVAVGLGLIGLTSQPRLTFSTPPVARYGELTDCRWVSPLAEPKAGDDIRPGQRIELSAGTANILFTSGARVQLIGPAIMEPLSANSAFLLLGQAAVEATSPTAKGFALETRTSRLVDLGTVFIAAAAADGQSRVDVAVGAVDVKLEGVAAAQHLTAGDALCVEPGERQIMTRIECGDETSAFRFPTIEPPSRDDYADESQHHATVRVLGGKLHRGRGGSGPARVLLDGHGQTHEDAPDESTFFSDNAGGFFLLDLGKVVSVSKINTYSWHQNTTYLEQRQRAVQKYTLYGNAGTTPPPVDGDLTSAGWVRVARINSDDYFRVARPLDRPAQQACSVTSPRGLVGRFRYLLWEVEATVNVNPRYSNNTFYGEFDVYAQP